MKNKIILSAIITSLALLPTMSFAEDSTTSVGAKAEIKTEMRLRAQEELENRKQELEEKKDQIREEIRTRTEAFKAEVEAKRETVKNEVEQRRENVLNQMRERLHNFVGTITERFEAAVSRLERLAERIDSRIAKFEEAGTDVTEAKDLLAVAELKIETAKASVAAIGVNAEVVLSDTSTTTEAIKNDYQGLREQIEQAKTDIKVAHAALVDVITSLKSNIEN